MSRKKERYTSFYFYVLYHFDRFNTESTEFHGVFGTKKHISSSQFFRQKNKRTYSALSFCSFDEKKHAMSQD